ncbi:hypothetical protein D3C76_1788410 [compost metagenome]
MAHLGPVVNRGPLAVESNHAVLGAVAFRQGHFRVLAQHQDSFCHKQGIAVIQAKGLLAERQEHHTAASG